jgi:hypothetical protein
LATEELRQRHRNHSTKFIVTARRLAEFLQSVEAEESLLIQRKCDLESRVIRQVVAGGLDGENHPLFPGESHVATAETVTIEEPAVDEVYGVF